MWAIIIFNLLGWITDQDKYICVRSNLNSVDLVNAGRKHKQQNHLVIKMNNMQSHTTIIFIAKYQYPHVEEFT